MVGIKCLWTRNAWKFEMPNIFVNFLCFNEQPRHNQQFFPHVPVWKMVTAKDKFLFWFKRVNLSVFAGHARSGQRSIGLICCEQWICSTKMRFHTQCAGFVCLKLRWRCHDLDNSGICVSCTDLRTKLCQNHDAGWCSGSQVVVVLGVWYSDEAQLNYR